jgi:hypothetical protein
MNRTSSRTEPISVHLQRHRDCLERRRVASANTRDRDDMPGLSPFDWRARPFAMLPFERQDDDE